MAIINDSVTTATFDDIDRLETTDPVLGGSDTSASNKQALALARRTKYLLNRVNGTVQKAVWTTTVITATNASAYTVPANVVSALLSGKAPGGGGAYSATSAVPGGGEGASIQDYPVTLTPGAVMAATIGAVGTGGTVGTPNGGTGGNCVFAGVTLGGGVGAVANINGPGGAGGTVTLGGIVYSGAPGQAPPNLIIAGSGGGQGGGLGTAGVGTAGVSGGGGAGGGGTGSPWDGGNGGPGYFVLKVLTLVPVYTA